MTTKSATHLSLADSSVLTSVRGWPPWAVVLLAVALTFAGTAVDGLTTGALSWGLRIGFYLGVVLAALLVRRRSIFTAMVQPPLVLVFGIIVGGWLFTNAGGMYGTAWKIIGHYRYPRPPRLCNTIALQRHDPAPARITWSGGLRQ